MKINCSYQKMVPISQLVEHPQNANVHPQKQIEMLAKILNYQGWRHPIVVSADSGYIVSGHGRLAAAKLNGWSEVPVDVQKFDDKAQELAFLLSDNLIAELAETNQEMVQEIAVELGDSFDLELLGTDQIVLNSFDHNSLDDKIEQDKPQEFKVEVLCVNGDEMTKLVNELTERGMIAKAIFRG